MFTPPRGSKSLLTAALAWRLHDATPRADHVCTSAVSVQVQYHLILSHHSTDPRTHQHCLQSQRQAGSAAWWLLLESGRRPEPSSAHWFVIQILIRIQRRIQIRTQTRTQIQIQDVGCCLKAGEEQRLQVFTHPSHALPGLACSAFQSLEPSHIQPRPRHVP